MQSVNPRLSRDHREINHQLDLFHFDSNSPGMVLWHPNGAYLFERLQQWLRLQLIAADYQEVRSPVMLEQSQWLQSGHAEKFADEMFICRSEKRDYALKPMNCPAHILIFKQQPRHFNQLPFRYFDFSPLLRNEPSGALHGLLRLRAFHQDDGHIFVRHDQISAELLKVIQLMIMVLNQLGFQCLEFKLALRPKQRFGDEAIWDKAERELREALRAAGLNFEELPGEGAFYGPKIECHLVDSSGRRWQCGTVQLDYLLPQRMQVNYLDQEGQKHQVAIIHRALLGSLERFIGIWLEENNGRLPLWCHPQPILLIAVSQSQSEVCRRLVNAAKQVGIQAEWRLSKDSIKHSIKQAWSHSCRCFALVGEKEIQQQSILMVIKGQEKQIVKLSSWPQFLEQFGISKSLNSQ